MEQDKGIVSLIEELQGLNEKIFSDSVEAIKREYESKIRILEDHIKEIQTGGAETVTAVREFRLGLEHISHTSDENVRLRASVESLQNSEQELRKELQHAHAKYQEAEREHQEQKTNLERQKEIQHNEYIKIISQKQDEIDKLTKQIISEKENSSESNKGASKEVAKLHLQLSEKDRLINDMKMKHAEALAIQEQKFSKQRVRFEEQLVYLSTQVSKSGGSANAVESAVRRQIDLLKENYEGQLSALRSSLQLVEEANRHQTSVETPSSTTEAL